MANHGYHFYFAYDNEVRTFPITPSDLTIKVGSNNKVVNLIDGGDINILKSPSLMEISFDARFPMRQYPYAREFVSFNVYLETFKQLKEQKRSFRFIVARSTPNGKRTWDTNILVSLEDFTVEESANEGDDVIISFNLKQYKDYGVNLVSNSVKRPTYTLRDNKTLGVPEDATLSSISKLVYGTCDYARQIYQINKSALDDEARAHGYDDSGNGELLFTGTTLTFYSAEEMQRLLAEMKRARSKTYVGGSGTMAAGGGEVVRERFD